MNRYITVVHKSNNGVNQFNHRIYEADYDVIRFDTEKKEFVYGDDKCYAFENFSFWPYGIEDINPYNDLSDEEFEALNEELLSVGDDDIDELATNENFCGFLRERLSDEQYNVIEKYRKRMHDIAVQKCIEKYNNNFTIENEKLRENNRNSYSMSCTPTGTCYYDEGGVLYRIISGMAPEVIYNSAYPDKIDSKMIDK